MKKSIFPFALFFGFIIAGCSSNTAPPPCTLPPTAAQCLEDSYCNACESKGVDIETLCQDVLKDHYDASKKELDLVPELSGTENTLRERYDVSYADQPYLYIPIALVPETYYLRNAKFNLLNINDGILSASTLHPLLPDLEFNPTSPLLGRFLSKAAASIVQITPPIRATKPAFMFQGLTYNENLISQYLDSLYTGKVAAWNDNGRKVESCEEYAYEKFYDFSLYKDFSSLHSNDPLRVVEYAYRGSELDAEGIHVNDNDLLPGSIGSKFMSVFAIHSYPVALKDIIQRKGANPGEPLSIFNEMGIFYSNYVNYENSSFYEISSPDISIEVYWNHEFSKNQARMICAEPKPGCMQFPTPDYMPKNFFVEVLGHINRNNTVRTSGIIIDTRSLQSVFDIAGFDSAQECYDNSFKHHFLMLKAAKRMYPSSTVLKQKLLEFKLLRKHLIQLLAERARYEDRMNPWSKKFSETILTTSETLPPSEKEYAEMKLYENISKPLSIAVGKSVKKLNVFQPNVNLGNVIVVENALKKIDDQIQAVLLEAQSKGCLDVYIWGSNDNPNLNYPISYNTDEIVLDYNKALCDWTPEMFTTAAIDLIPDSYYENVYANCMRVTGGDFDDMNVDNFKFQFPSKCQSNNLFKVWTPNGYVDYTTSTVKFREFESLVQKYPAALLDCDSVIQRETTKTLAEADMNYFDPVTGKVMMSKSRSYYDSIGGEYAGLEFGYALGWLYEGYDGIATIDQQNLSNRDFVCANTGFFSFGNYFAGGSFLGRDFTLCSAGSYASNKTSGNSRPVPPTLARQENEDRINSDINAVAAEKNVNTTYFMFIKNEKMTFSYNNGNFNQTPVKYTHSQNYSGDDLSYQSPTPEAQMISVDVQKSVPICGIISITIRGAVTGDIDAATTVTTDKKMLFNSNKSKNMNFAFTPAMDFDAFAQASVTAGISGVASISAGVETGLKFVGVRFPYTANLSITQNNGTADDRPFNYDIFVNAYNNLDQNITLLSGYFGAFVKIEYIFDSDTYRQTLFSWDGITFNGNVDRVGKNQDGVITPLSVPVKALYGLSKNLYKG